MQGAIPLQGNFGNSDTLTTFGKAYIVVRFGIPHPNLRNEGYQLDQIGLYIFFINESINL